MTSVATLGTTKTFITFFNNVFIFFPKAPIEGTFKIPIILTDSLGNVKTYSITVIVLPVTVENITVTNSTDKNARDVKPVIESK